MSGLVYLVILGWVILAVIAIKNLKLRFFSLFLKVFLPVYIRSGVSNT